MRVRIVNTPEYFRVETWRWWWPFWCFNSLSSHIDGARKVANYLKHPTIEEIL